MGCARVSDTEGKPEHPDDPKLLNNHLEPQTGDNTHVSVDLRSALEQQVDGVDSVVQCLRLVPAAELVRAQHELELLPAARRRRHALSFPFAPVLDGRVLLPADDPLQLRAEVAPDAAATAPGVLRNASRVPVSLLLGLNAAEMSVPLLYELAGFFGRDLRADPKRLTYVDLGTVQVYCTALRVNQYFGNRSRITHVISNRYIVFI